MSTSAISLSTTAPKQTAAAPEKTGIFESIKSIFKRGAAAATAPLTPERVTPDAVKPESLETFLLVTELSKKNNSEIFDIFTQVINNKINSRDIREIERAMILNDCLSVVNSEGREIQAREKLVLALLDPKYSPVQAALLTVKVFERNYLNKEEVEKIAVELGKRTVAESMDKNLPIQACGKLGVVLNIFLASIFDTEEGYKIIDKVLPIEDLITATVNKFASANGPSVSSRKTKDSVVYYAMQLVPNFQWSYFCEQVMSRLEAVEKFESDKVKMARLANEKANADTRAAKEARAEKLAKDVAAAEARAKANIKRIKKEAAKEVGRKGK